jgi:DNA-binding response OmpR family regulator
MMTPSTPSLVLAFAFDRPLVGDTDLSGLNPIPVRWHFDFQELLVEVGLAKPTAVVVLCRGDHVESLRTCYALRQATSAPLHLLSLTMSESEANLASSLGVTTVQTASFGALIVVQLIKQFIELSAQTLIEEPPKTFEVAGMSLDLPRRQLWIQGARIALTRTEFELFASLVRAAGAVITRAKLVAIVWGENWFGVENVLDTHLAHLRRKLAGSGFDRTIVNVRGVGFYFETRNIARAQHELVSFAAGG